MNLDFNTIKTWFSPKPANIRVGFEDVKYAICHTEYFIINTLSIREQDCLIHGTIPSDKEEQLLNGWIDKGDTGKLRFIVYGKNASDETAKTKYDELKSFGFNGHIYGGGLFEWLLLQDIYGFTEFPTTGVCKDLLKYRELRCSEAIPSSVGLIKW